MQNQDTYQYILEPYKGMSTRFQCPQCLKRKVYVRYIDTNTGERLPEKYGKCERLNNCAYHLNPYTDGYQTTRKDLRKQNLLPIQKTSFRNPIYIPNDLFENSLQQYDKNNFVQLLIRLFGKSKAMELTHLYKIGTSSCWNGATIFWIIDEQKRVVGGQVVLFDEDGNTKKEKRKNGSVYRYTTWIHTVLKQSYRKQNQAIPKWLKDYSEYAPKFPIPYGLQAIDSTKPIAIVEAPKTAIIASAFFSQYNWLAIGGATYLNNIYRIQPLVGKNITLFPDTGCYEQWLVKAKEYSHLANFTVSDLLERRGSPLGDDLADYLIRNTNDTITQVSKCKNIK